MTGSPTPARELPTLQFPSQQAWERWLEVHHQDSQGLWLLIGKKGCEVPSVSYAEALDSALCYGWIDGQKGAHDHQFWRQRFTPRRARSQWSRVNRDRIRQLTEQGRMRAAGLAQVERAQLDGRWEAAYQPQSRATVPEDLQTDLDRNANAQAFFATLDAANRYAILYRIQATRTPAARARRIHEFISMLEEHRTLHPTRRTAPVADP